MLPSKVDLSRDTTRPVWRSMLPTMAPGSPGSWLSTSSPSTLAAPLPPGFFTGGVGASSPSGRGAGFTPPRPPPPPEAAAPAVPAKTENRHFLLASSTFFLAEESLANFLRAEDPMPANSCRRSSAAAASRLVLYSVRRWGVRT